MKIFYSGYFSNIPHSWAHVSQSMTRSFVKMGHECGVIDKSPESPRNFPAEFIKLKNETFPKADMSWSYTIPPNWLKRFNNPTSFRAGMYAYESSFLPQKKPNFPWPKDWGKMYEHIDKVIAPSNYVKEIFENSGTPDHKIAIVPHGVDSKIFSEDGIVHKLNTKKSFKFLAVATSLWRKNIQQLLRAYVSTFTKDDDVCLIIKTSKPDPRSPKQYYYDIGPDLQTCASLPNCPEIITLYGRFQNIAPLYRACDCYVNISASEGFGIIFLESMACGLITMAPRYSGHLDFLNDKNSILLDCDEVFADPRYQYWDYNPSAVVSKTKDEDLIDKMKYVYNNKEKILLKKQEHMRKTVKEFSWENAAKTMLEICK